MASKPDLMVSGGHATVNTKWLRSQVTAARVTLAAFVALLAACGGTIAAIYKDPGFDIPAAFGVTEERIEEEGRLVRIETTLENQGEAVSEMQAEQKRQTEILHELKGGIDVLIRKEAAK